MTTIGALIVVGLYHLGNYVLMKNVVVPAAKGIVDGVREGKKELKEERKKNSSEKEAA